MSRLFVRVMKLSSAKEDVFTECLAATLADEPELASSFLGRLEAGRAGSATVEPRAVEVETQKTYPGCCVDMVITSNGRTVGVENKLWSPEGDQQLARYLRLGFDGLAFVTGDHTPVTGEVLRDARYLKPINGRAHFLWADFHDLVERFARRPRSSPLTRALLALFAHLGFEPAHAEIGDLIHPDRTIQTRNRENFAKLWEATRAGLAGRGWKSVGRGSIAELYVRDGSARRTSWAWIDPTWARGMLRVRLTPNEGVSAAELEAAVQAVEIPGGDDVQVLQAQPPGRKTEATVVDILVPLKRLLGEARGPEDMASRLAAFVLAVFDAAG